MAKKATAKDITPFIRELRLTKKRIVYQSSCPQKLEEFREEYGIKGEIREVAKIMLNKPFKYYEVETTKPVVNR